MSRRMILLIGIATLMFAETPVPFGFQLAQVDRIFALCSTQSTVAGSALELLELIAGGRLEQMAPGADLTVGLKPGELGDPSYKSPTVRAHAMRRIGESHLPGALKYLENLDPSAWNVDDQHQIWPVAQIALREAKLSGIVDPQGRIEFLEKTLREPNDALSDGAVSSWAADKLCDAGAMASFPLVRDSIWQRNPTDRGQDDIRFCEARLTIDARGPTRVRALGSVLNTATSGRDKRLTRWALIQLASIKSPEALAELERFDSEIAALPKNSPERLDLFPFRAEIQSLKGK